LKFQSGFHFRIYDAGARLGEPVTHLGLINERIAAKVCGQSLEGWKNARKADPRSRPPAYHLGTHGAKRACRVDHDR